MSINLDDPELLKSRDLGGMLKALSSFPEACRAAIEEAERLPLENMIGKSFDEVVILGIGGSAIGGDLIKDWVEDECAKPIYVHRGYGLPRFVDERTLVFAVSYSGNTEETLSALKEAVKHGCSTVALTSGGFMEGLSFNFGIPCLKLQTGLKPRASLPNQFFGLAKLFERLGLIKEVWGEVDEALALIKEMRVELSPATPTELNMAKKIAISLKGKIPFIYGCRLLKSVAYRIKTQLNENSKIVSGSGFFPEAFHNVVVSSEGPPELLNQISYVLLIDPRESQTVLRKIEFFKQLFKANLCDIIEIEARGGGRLARMLSTIYVGDYASAYLSLLYGFDPSSTESIEKLKRVQPPL
ncbi:bifunctional phosphoglucose/phosphomannose isomerase [Candidatus Bathyarchaeota archaeon]|nr:bifunctional phosphoglucose/phosphomannose isomerase [Candidatus Bathyarchaeota archaeon]